MKSYAILILFFVVYGCGSHQRSIDTSYVENRDVEQTKIETENIKTEASTLSVHSTTTQTEIKQYTRTTSFQPDGSVSAIQEEWRNTGQNVVADSTRQRSDVSGIIRKDSTNTHRQEKIEINEHSESESDSRMVQGIEWFYLALAAGGVLVFVWFFKRMKN